MKEVGHEEGATCSRDGCCGSIKMRPADNCSCHLSAPCGACTEPRNFCPECDWEEADDPAPEPAPPTPEQLAAWKAQSDFYKPRTLADLDSSKIDWISKSHSNSSMIKEGRCPPGTGMADVVARVTGTFGGRFEYWNPESGHFKFIAYTD